jgi:hypothetical protein
LGTTGATWQSAAGNCEWFGAEAEGATGVIAFASSTWREKISTKRLFAERKSTPKISFETVNEMSTGLNQSVFETLP